MKYKGSVWCDVPKQPKKSKLHLRVERVIKKAEKINYKFNDIELGMFSALARDEWDEKKVNWLALEQFDRLYYRFYP
ncbi:hypothetical protein [Paenibacillus agilis]|uniref:Uncharacterized protein n=1 Tax=Paenibacillus agilis TaxID=3020863 RepID=A0A559ID49_9BACL|nr:hypothetical protein [Paenibacillus agilis]TVX85589.1 hypothetical protein FPZ44_24855 [Paenibacillus agilis]